MSRRILSSLALMACFVAGTSCATAPARGSTGTKKIRPLEISLPSELAGLRVQRETITEPLEKFRRAYAESVALISLRAPDDLVLATLQITRFIDAPRFTTQQFRLSVISQLGSTKPQPTRMGDITVHRAKGTKQTLAIWYQGRHMFLLSIRDDFAKPRLLIREAVEIKP